MNSPSATGDDVRHAYRLLLGRDADEQGYANHLALIEKSSPTVTDLARGFFGSPEFLARFGCLVRVPMGNNPPRGAARLPCQACTQEQIESPTFLYWARRLGERPGGLNRKVWEWCFITQALHERGALRAGSRGLGFAVGTEPLTALFASMGSNVVATDLDQALASDAGWVASDQHADSIEQLNRKGLCPPEDFARRVKFRSVDMRAIPADLRGFDFLWSSCALEHLGSLQNGLDFVLSALNSLRTGGIAVHTTELNCESDVDTIETGGSVVYRKSDLLALAANLRDRGHQVEPFDFYTGESEADLYVDEFPYGGPAHIKLRIAGFAATSFGLIIVKGDGSSAEATQ